MHIQEYNNVRNMTYLQYCDYLQKKYGIGLSDYMTEHYSVKKSVSRTKDGLIAHHKFEDHASMLSSKPAAKACPFEWQTAKNIVYCDCLEHLFLHVLICEYPSANRRDEFVGVSGIIEFIVPELNDFYSGWKTNQEWRKNCHNLIEKDKDVYLIILKRFIHRNKMPFVNKETLCRSLNSRFGSWSSSNNKAIYREIAAL